MAKAKTALEQLHSDKQPHVVTPIPQGFPGWKDGDSMVVSTPGEIDGIVRQIPRGALVTLNEVRAHLARKHGTDIACPVSTAIFLNVVARAAAELESLGETGAPYWRVLRPGGLLNEKYPGGTDAHRALLESEGYTVVQVRKTWKVDGYERSLFTLD
ncbi:MAG: MGMT family protein [bacterium]|nr:MGMT family protein [bacterium]